MFSVKIVIIFVLLFACYCSENTHEIFKLSRLGETHKIEMLLREDRKLANLIDINKKSPLYHAIYGVHKDTVILLMNCGASLNMVDKHNRNPLEYAKYLYEQHGGWEKDKGEGERNEIIHIIVNFIRHAARTKMFAEMTGDFVESLIKGTSKYIDRPQQRY